jgi:hypothetical protein
MRSREWLLSHLRGGTRRGIGILAAASLVLTAYTASVRAGDLSAQPDNGLSVTNQAAQLLPQTQSAETGWLSGLHISGYGSQTFGMWQNPTALRNFTTSRNNLATSRTLLQVDENYRLNEDNTFFMREWFVYEPPYSFNSGNNRQYSLSSVNHASFGHFMNGFYNNYQVRDAWWENKTGPLTTFVGNQIVVWGQSIAFRVGDVINPADTCWAFGFANLEQSRNPQWMIHPILNLPEFGGFTSNFLEVVWQPGFAPVYWPEQNTPYGIYKDESSKAGRAVPCQPAASHGPSGRFDVHYDNTLVFGADVPIAPGPYPYNGNGLVSSPTNIELMYCTNLNPLITNPGFNYIPARLRHPCKIGLSKGNNPYSPIGNGSLFDFGNFRIPGFQPYNWNDGARFHTLWGPIELTALLYYDNANGLGIGTEASAKWTPYTNLWTYQFMPVLEGGATADAPLPMPASLAEYFPAVGRAEMLYINHQSLNDTTAGDLTAQRFSDVVETMEAIDLDQAYAPWLTATGNLSANVEVNDTTILDLTKFEWFGNDLHEHDLKNNVNILFNLGTSWWWEDFAPTWTMIYNPKGNTFLLFPSIVLNPPWTKKYFVKLQAIEVLGSDNESAGGGLFKGESLLTAQFQYNFNLL